MTEVAKKKENERGRVVNAILGLAENGNTTFTIETLLNAYNLMYFPTEAATELITEFATESEISEGAALAKIASTPLTGSWRVPNVYTWRHFADGAKENVHFHYYVKKFIKEGLVESAGRSSRKGRAKIYKINFDARTVAKLKLSGIKGKSLKKRVRRKPLTVELRYSTVVRNDEGNYVRDDEGNAIYTTRIVDVAELANLEETDLKYNHLKVFAAEDGEDFKAVATLYVPGWNGYSSRRFSLTGHAGNGRHFERFFRSAENAVKSVKYRKLDYEFAR